MSKRHSRKRCAKCGAEGFRFRGDRWLCVVHNRFDTMVNCARMKGKAIPTADQLAALAAELVKTNMACPHCKVPMVWTGRHGLPNVVSLQHDRSGRIRFLCMLCNQRHDDMPGDTFYDCPKDHKFCPKCKVVKPLSEFPKWNVKGRRHQWPPYCRPCQKELSRISWAKYVKTRRIKRVCVQDGTIE